jgi:hypothetical protein
MNIIVERTRPEVSKVDGAYLAGHISKAENINTWWPITYWYSITGKYQPPSFKWDPQGIL